MSDERTTRSPLYRSLISGEPLTLRGARLATVSVSDIPRRPRFTGIVEKADIGRSLDRKAIEAINMFYWSSLEQEIFGRTYNILDCDNYIARPSSTPQDDPDSEGPLTHGIAGHVALFEEPEGFLHIVVFHVWPQWHGRGVGREFLNTSIDEARSRGLSVIKLGTTNDNLPALYFYQRAGFVIEQVVCGEVLRGHGAELIGFSGIPVRDEIQMRLELR